MAVTNNIKSQVDMPVWEWNRFAPTTTAAGLSTCVDESSGGRFIYYITTTTFWRYDTVTDAWQQLQAPQTVALTASSLRYSTYGGARGRVISAGATSITIPEVGASFIGDTIRITEGTGVGQERVISASAGEVIADSGIASAADANSITDNQTIPKKWLINQWRGYSVRVVFGTGQSQVRKVLYNDTNTLTFYNANWQAMDHWGNTPFAGATSGVPYIAPAAGAHYYIISETLTVPQWTTNPDNTSKFMIKSGAVWLVSGRSLVNGAASIQYYSVAEDIWYLKTCPGGLMGYLLTGDVSIERCGEIGGDMDSGDCDASASRTMVDATKTWTVDQWVGFSVIVNETATEVKQRNQVIGNTASTLYFDQPWTGTPDTNFTYVIQGNANNIWLAGNNYSTLYKYLVEQDMWTDGWHYDEGICANLSAQFGKQKPFSYTATSIAAGVTAVTTAPVTAGAGYKVGDIVTVTTGGTGCKVRVTSIGATGNVLAVELYCPGVSGTHTPGNKATVLLIPAAGGDNNLVVNIASVGTTSQGTTAFPHNLKSGDVITTAGASVAGWNANFTITCVDTLTTFNYIGPNTTAPSASNSNAAGTLVDASKNWTSGEFIGKRAIIYIAGTVPTSQVFRITANGATTLTLAGGTPVTATSRYMIVDQKCFGSDRQLRNPAENNIGWADGGGSGTLLHTSDGRDWLTNQWVGCKLRVICGTGFDKGEVAITANNDHTLTSAAWGFTPDATTKYEIMDSFGVCDGSFGTTARIDDSTKNWAVNQWAGKSVRISAGAGQSVEVIIASNTKTTLVTGTITQPTATTMYSILGCNVRQIGTQIMWNYGQTLNKGKYLYVSRGGTTTALGTNTIDVYNITTNRWDFCKMMAPQSELFTIATQWAYDNKDRIYFSNAAVSSSRIGYIDLNRMEVIPAGQTPYAHGAGVQGNRMDIVETVDGLKYLYLMRQTGAEFWRTLIFW
jgi:hypothetical protein